MYHHNSCPIDKIKVIFFFSIGKSTIVDCGTTKDTNNSYTMLYP